MRGVLPALAFHFGLRWEHVEAMPRDELSAYISALDQLKGGG